MAVTKTTRVFAGILLYGFALGMFSQAYFFLWKVMPATASLCEGLEIRLPALVSVVINLWHFLGWPVFLLTPMLLFVWFLPERHFPRVAVMIGLFLFAGQVLLSCFFIYMQVLEQSYLVLALQKVAASS